MLKSKGFGRGGENLSNDPVAIPIKGRIPTVLHIPSIILTAKKNGVVYVGNMIDAKGFLYIVRKKLYL